MQYLFESGAGRPESHPPRNARRGITMIECLILMVVFSIISVAAGVGLQSVARTPGAVENQAWTTQQIVSKMEDLHDTPYAALASGSSTSDADYKNVTYTITWTVTEIDPASPTASPPVAKANSGLKQLVVSMNGQSLTTWVSQ